MSSSLLAETLDLDEELLWSEIAQEHSGGAARSRQRADDYRRNDPLDLPALWGLSATATQIRVQSLFAMGYLNDTDPLPPEKFSLPKGPPKHPPPKRSLAQIRADWERRADEYREAIETHGIDAMVKLKEAWGVGASAAHGRVSLLRKHSYLKDDQDRVPRSDVCSRGHPVPTGMEKGYRRCLVCREVTQGRYKDRKAEEAKVRQVHNDRLSGNGVRS